MKKACICVIFDRFDSRLRPFLSLPALKQSFLSHFKRKKRKKVFEPFNQKIQLCVEVKFSDNQQKISYFSQ